MRSLLTIAFLFVCLSCTNTSGKNVAAITAAVPPNAPKVLIELFTSQGCSSCPSADKLMGSLTSADTNIITLSFHVDYWDRLGWKDVFSNHDYTQRQQQYVSALHAESLYTPQAVVQGKYEMVGSNRTRIQDAIGKVNGEKDNSYGQLLTAGATIANNTVVVSYHLTNPAPQQQLVAVLAQNNASTAIARGENAGAKLNDYNVARSIQYNAAAADGTLQVSFPKDLKPADASVILFVQDNNSKQVTAVTQVKL